MRVNAHKLKNVISYLLLACFVGACIVYALGNNLDLYFSPTSLHQQNIPKNKLVKVGGEVVKDSITILAGSNGVRFKLIDKDKTILEIWYKGVLPDLFRAGQKVVVSGHIDESSEFIAKQVLAKHDETYKPNSRT